MKNEKELPKTYNAKDVETTLYKKWESNGAFQPKINKDPNAKPFVISIPPPNATGTLHLGHATMLAIEDLMVRYHRLRGEETLWLPGTDHAAIATQNVVEKQIWKTENKTRHDMGRKELLKRIEIFVEKSKNTIRNQIRRMGASVDWSRERYTLDLGLSKAVQMVFKMMYDDGLIYRGDRIVNWCTRCQTTLADDEVKYKETDTILYTFKYRHDFPITIATTRPETKLGDTGVAVHPDDKRYKKFVGQTFTVPFAEKTSLKLKIVADETIDPQFGTGAVGVTPAHSQTDAQIAERHNLPSKSVINEQGLINGLSVTEARKKIIDWLRNEKLIEKEETIKHNVSICYRCDTPIEPLISKQWFVAVNKPTQRLNGKTLRERASEIVNNNEIKIIPERFVKTYNHWMDNLHDWCISRQIWFGHRIPVYYCKLRTAKSEPQNPKCAEPIVSVTPITTCPHCQGGIEQDPDTLDTWFSSGLWTFSTLLNPDSLATNLEDWRTDSPDIKYHPTSVLETGYDILFFWVARMILLTTYTLNEVPFKNVYLHGMVRDREGRKMSKSLGNGIDPVDMIEKYGADAVRLSIIIGTTPGNDFRLYEEKIAGYRNFVNKLWNISRFILMNTKPTKETPTPKTLADKWILAEFAKLKKEINNHFENYRFSPAGEALYEFTWSKLADWYVEFSKIEKNKDAVLRFILRELLILWHPYTPFVSEHIWGELEETNSLLINADWPTDDESIYNPKDIQDINWIQFVVSEIRNYKQKNNGTKTFGITEKSGPKTKHKNIIEGLTRSKIEFTTESPEGATIINVFGGITIFTTEKDNKNTKARRAKERNDLEKQIVNLKALLNNKEFSTKAPEAVRQKEKIRLKEIEERLHKLNN